MARFIVEREESAGVEVIVTTKSEAVMLGILPRDRKPYPKRFPNPNGALGRTSGLVPKGYSLTSARPGYM